MNRASLFVPLGIFLLIIAFGYAGFRLNDPHQLPSALLNKPFPDFHAPLLMDPSRIVDRSDLLGSPVLVNVWATWCPTCKAEHAELMRIARETDLRLVGVVYKDKPHLAMRWLNDYGNPYDLVVQDVDGSLGVELGVYGAPETFLLDADGTIVYKRVGDVNPHIWRTEMQPLLARLEVTTDVARYPGSAGGTTGAASKTAGAASKTAGAASKTAGATSETAGATSETAGAASETARAASSGKN